MAKKMSKVSSWQTVVNNSTALRTKQNLFFICGIDCKDYMENVIAQERADFILNGAKDGVIVLFHDAAGNSQTVVALKIFMSSSSVIYDSLDGDLQCSFVGKSITALYRDRPFQHVFYTLNTFISGIDTDIIKPYEVVKLSCPLNGFKCAD